MFVHNIDPVLFTLGPFAIRYYGLIYAFGFVLAYFWMRNFAKRGTLRMDEEQLDLYIIWLIIGAVLGARLFEVLFWEPAYYFANPAKMIAIWEGGLSFHGGLFGTILVTYLFCRRYKLSFMNVTDHIVIPGSFALGLGRIANFINGELWGTITSVSWCVVFPAAGEACRHPVQIYGALAWIVTGILLLVIHKKNYERKKPALGLVFWWFIFLSGIGRFIVDFWRDDARWLGLSTGQYFSIVLILLGGYVLLNYHKKQKG